MASSVRRNAGADREAVQQARARVGDAERQQFPVGRNHLIAPCERPRGQHVIAETHDQHGERREQQFAQHSGVDIGQPERWQGRRDRTHDGHPMASQAERRNGGGGPQYGQQRTRRARPV